MTTLFNLRTRETLALLPGLPPQERFHNFLRDHYTNQATRMDERLVDVLARVATSSAPSGSRSSRAIARPSTT